jgi:hypothetical protein
VIFHARAEPGAEHEPVALEQHQRLGHEIRAPAPGRGADGGDAGTDGLVVLLVLGVAQGAEDDALLGGQGPSNLGPDLGRWQPPARLTPGLARADRPRVP